MSEIEKVQPELSMLERAKKLGSDYENAIALLNENPNGPKTKEKFQQALLRLDKNNSQGLVVEIKYLLENPNMDASDQLYYIVLDAIKEIQNKLNPEIKKILSERTKKYAEATEKHISLEPSLLAALGNMKNAIL